MRNRIHWLKKKNKTTKPTPQQNKQNKTQPLNLFTLKLNVKNTEAVPLRSVLSLLKIDLQTATHFTGNVRKESLNFMGIPTTVIKKIII